MVGCRRNIVPFIAGFGLGGVFFGMQYQIDKRPEILGESRSDIYYNLTGASSATTTATAQLLLPLLPATQVHSDAANHVQLPGNNSNATSPTGRESTNAEKSANSAPGTFVRRFKDCMLDDRCHTIFLHIAKTGGTTLESALGLFFNPKERVVGARWSCCGNELMDRFRAHKEEYCLSPFRPFQVGAADIPEILDACREVYREMHAGENGVRTHYLEVLVSIREPITRELSKIHQMCNKNFASRGKQWQEACRRCSFGQDQKFWLRGASSGTNQNYEDLLALLSTPGHGRVATANETAAMVALPANVPTYLIDMSDISPFLSELKQSLNELGSRLPIEGKQNKESKALCNFHMPSDLMKALSPALSAYRAIITGEKGTEGAMRYTAAD